MRFTLAIPTVLAGRWSQDGPRRWVATGDARTSITISDLLPLPDDLDSWVQSVVLSDLAPGTAVQSGTLTELTTAKGWPMRLIDARLLEGDRIVELRLVAFYRFFAYGGFALARAPGPEPHAQLARDAVDLVVTAEPDWSDEVVAVHQLWEGVERLRVD